MKNLKKQKITKENLVKLKKLLPKGWAEEVAGKLGYTKALVYEVLKGNTPNNQVIEMCIELALKEQQRIADLNDRISNLTKE